MIFNYLDSYKGFGLFLVVSCAAQRAEVRNRDRKSQRDITKERGCVKDFNPPKLDYWTLNIRDLGHLKC